MYRFFKLLINNFGTGALMLAVMTVLTGVVYPLAVTGISQVLFPSQAHGSLIFKDNRVVGSALIGQQFNDPGHFMGRPSATSPVPYNAAASAGSNLGPTNPALRAAVLLQAEDLRRSNPANTADIPVDLVTASASGLDPDISVASAVWQIPRISKARGLSEARIRRVIDESVSGRQFLVFGESRFNVLKANLTLNSISARADHE